MSNTRIQQDPRNGVYYVQIQRAGLRRHFKLGDNRKEAERELKRIQRDIATGKISFTLDDTTATKRQGVKDIQLAELAIRHLEWVKVYRSPATFSHRQRFVFQFMRFLGIGAINGGKFEFQRSMLVSEITRSTMTEYHVWCRRNSRQHPNAGNAALREAKTLLLWGVEEELCDLSFRKFPPITEVPPVTKRIDLIHLPILFEKAPQDLVDVVKFGLLTGLRPKEIRDLKTDQIVRPDDGRWHVRIEHHKTAGRTKDRFPRSVPLTGEAKEIVLRQLGQHPKSAYVFLNDDGTPYERTALRNRLIRWCRRAKIPDITPYALRHTFASIESDNHVESTALARLMGHATTVMLGRYISNSHEHDFEAVQTAEATLARVLERGRVRTGTAENRAKNYCRTTVGISGASPDSSQVVGG